MDKLDQQSGDCIYHYDDKYVHRYTEGSRFHKLTHGSIVLFPEENLSLVVRI